MIYFVFTCLFFVSFFVVLNGFLQGVRKPQIDTILGVFLVGLIVLVFAGWGWKIGLVSVVFSFISAGLIRPFARACAKKIMDKDWLEEKTKYFFK